MDTLFTLIYAAAILITLVTVVRSRRNRFLPMAAPIGVLATLLMFVCSMQLITHALGVDVQSLPTLVTVLGFSASVLILPIWVQIFVEYKYGKKVSLVRNFWLWIEPSITLVILAANSLLAKESSRSSAIELLGAYHPVHFAYMVTVGASVLAWSVYTVSNTARNNRTSLLQFGICLAAPMLLFFAFRVGLIDKPIGASALVLVLVWAARESNLLDVIPSALSGVLNRVNAGVLVFNVQHQLVYCNQFAQQRIPLGDGARRLQSNKVTLSSLPEWVTSSFDFDNKHPQHKLLQSASAKQRYFDANLNAINNDKTQQFLGYILLLQDVSDRERSEIELAQSNRQLEDLNRQKSDFFAGISHEFRTPLTLSIGGISDIINGDYGSMSTDVLPVLNNVKQNNQRLLNLVAQLLELSRLNQSAALYHPQAVDVIVAIESVAANFESLAPKQHTKIALLNHSQSRELWFDPNSLEKVLMNLLSNAFKSIKQGGEVQLRVSEDQDSIIVSVQDTGHGIPDTVLPHIFDAFYYHDNRHIDWPSGAGVGLYLVRQILQAHGASISVNSSLEQGTEFVIHFVKGQQHLKHLNLDGEKSGLTTSPIAIPRQALNPEPSDKRQQTPPDSPAPLSENLVLVVEDNVQMRRYIRHHLGKEFRLIEAEDGEEGFELAKQSVPDLILSDLMMPKLNGMQLSEKIRNTHATSHIPIILLTARSDPKDKLDGLQIGVDDYITKPFDASELVARIHNFINSREQLRQRFANRTLVSSNSTSLPKSDANVVLNKESLFLENLQRYVFENTEGGVLRITSIAEQFHMSDRSLHRKLNALVGMSPKQYVTKLRMECAANLLTETDQPINNIALDSGFSDSAHFSRAFKNHHKVSPLEYRKQHQPNL